MALGGGGVATGSPVLSLAKTHQGPISIAGRLGSLRATRLWGVRPVLLWRDGRWVHGRGAFSCTVMRETVRPAEGHPAIVTGCAGVSCPVTLVAGVSDCRRAARAAPPPPARSLHCTSTVTQRHCSRQVPSSNRARGLPRSWTLPTERGSGQKRTRCEAWRIRARTGCRACVKDALPGCSVPPTRALTRPRPPKRTPRRPFHRGRPRSAGVGRPLRVRKT
jgi:hypothetical protein